MAEFLSKWLIKQRKPNINCIGLWLVPNLKSSGVKSSEPITHLVSCREHGCRVEQRPVRELCRGEDPSVSGCIILFKIFQALLVFTDGFFT